jgi:DNA-binding response OmpR family regulator
VPHILIATDAEWILNDVQAALGGPDTSWTICRAGQHVVPAVRERTPDLAVLDLQIGNMGAMAVTMALRLEESGDRLPHIPVLMLLDRRVDLFLAERSGAEGWLIKPLDSMRLRRAAQAVLDGQGYTEGVTRAPDPAEGDAAVDPNAAAAARDVVEPAGGTTAAAG